MLDSIIKTDSPHDAIEQVISEAARLPEHGHSLFIMGVSVEQVDQHGFSMVSDSRVPSEARDKIRAIARGKTINGTYKMDPGDALNAFWRDLLLLVDDAK